MRIACEILAGNLKGRGHFRKQACTRDWH